jgi:hypothetical protein
VSDPNDDSIPVLHEILVQGHPVQARQASHDAAGFDAPREPGFKAEPVLAPQPVLTPEQVRSVQPVHAAEPEHAQAPGFAAQPVHAQEPAFAAQPVHAQEPAAFAPQPHAQEEAAHTAQPSHPADHHHPKKRARAHHAAQPRHAHDDGYVPSAGVFDRAEPATPLEAGSTVPPDIAREGASEAPLDLDADVIAERLRGRVAEFLASDGRSIIEDRCRETLQAHTGWLINQITREVALTLEKEMTGWVREAVLEEIARRASVKG